MPGIFMLTFIGKTSFSMRLRHFVDNITVKQLFGADSIGAVLSAVMLGVVLPTFQQLVGMPVDVLHLLAAIPVVYSIYSLLCYLLVNRKWRSYLFIIATANILYCILTLSLVAYHYPMLTVWGIIYFTAEAAIIITLAYIEYCKAKSDYI